MIAANNTTGSITVDTGETVTLTLNLDSGFISQQPGDWWVIKIDPQGAVEYFDLTTMTFKSGLSPTVQGQIISFPPISLAVVSGLSAGDYSFYFGVDLIPNNNLDVASLFYSGVIVYVNGTGGVIDDTPLSHGSDKAMKAKAMK